MKNNISTAGLFSRSKRHLVLTLLTACCLVAGGSIAGATDIPVKITFNASKCPASVNVAEAQVKNNNVDKVVWTAVNAGGAYNGGYSIYFDPFRGGKPLETKKIGNPNNNKYENQITSQPVDKKVPANTIFKYSVIGNECAGPALDPRIKVF